MCGLTCGERSDVQPRAADRERACQRNLQGAGDVLLGAPTEQPRDSLGDVEDKENEAEGQ